MSFLTEKMIRPVARTIPRVALYNAPRAAPFSASVAYQKSPVESVKDAAKKVDRTVSDNVLIPGLDATQNAKQKIKETVNSADPQGKAEELKSKAAGLKDEAAGKAQELKNEAAGKAQEFKGEAQELKGEAAGKAQELKGEAKGKAAEAKGKAKEVKEDAKAKI